MPVAWVEITNRHAKGASLRGARPGGPLPPILYDASVPITTPSLSDPTGYLLCKELGEYN